MQSFPDSEVIESQTLHEILKFSNSRTLEVGCGDGRLTRHYAKETRQSFGADLDFDELSLAFDDYLRPHRKKVGLAQARAEALPYPNRSFDLVLLGWSLCCVSPGGQAEALREALRVSTGLVLDIRAVLAPPEIWIRTQNNGDLNCGPLTKREPHTHYNEEASQIVNAALTEGWLRLEDRREFEWIDVYETVDELIGEITDEWESWIIEEDLALKTVNTFAQAGRGAVPFVRQGVQAQLLCKVDK